MKSKLLTISITMDNAAFEQAASREVARILTEQVIERLSDAVGGGLDADVFKLRDINGNAVGTVVID